MNDTATEELGSMIELEKIGIDDLAAVAEHAKTTLRKVQKIVLKPNPQKTPPVFPAPYLAELCEIDRTQIRYLSEKHKLPYGVKVEGSKSLGYPLKDTIQWSKTLRNWPSRPADKPGVAIAIVNYKGGVAKTSTAVTLAQGLTLRGLSVLLVDCDGQGTATQLCGIDPEDHVTEEQTIMEYIYGTQPNLDYAVRETYWTNMHLIPASSVILAAEFALPALAVDKKGFEFYHVLRNGIEPLKNRFDVIIFDTSPSLSHLTVNAMLAADGLIMPCPPESLDFASSVQFWGLFTELAQHFKNVKDKKKYDFMTVIATKVKAVDSHRLVKPWLKQAYGVHMNDLEIPDSEAAKQSLARLKTIYDLEKPDGSPDAYRRVKEPFDQFCNQILDKLAAAWRS